MKSLKSKLMAAGAMLMVSVVMLTSASFAWFTVSTAPEVKDIKVTMTATKNLEIAEAGTNKTTAPGEVTANDTVGAETKFGSIITFGDTPATVNFPATVDTDKALKTVQYGKDGRTVGLVAGADGTVLANGIGSYTATITVPDGTGNATTTASKTIAATYGMWLRSNVEATTGAPVTVEITLPESINAAFAAGYRLGTTTAAKTDTAVAAKTGESLGDLTALTKSGNTLSATFAMAADTAQYVELVFYFDGNVLTAADVDADLAVTGINVKFTSAALTA